MEFYSPFHPHPVYGGLRPYQEEMVEKYLAHRELFLGVARQIGTTTVLSGIAAWELTSRPGCVVAVDTDQLFQQTINKLKTSQWAPFRQTKSELHLSNGSILITLPKYPFKGIAVDVMLLEPSSCGIRSVQDFDSWFMGVRPALKPDTGKLLIACVPCGPIKNLYKSWLSMSKPMAMFDYVRCDMIGTLGLDWFEEMTVALTPAQFAAELCCDFSVCS